MPRTARQSKLLPLQDEILSWRNDGLTYTQICERLKRRGIQITETPLRTQVRSWDSSKPQAIIARGSKEELQPLRTQVIQLYQELGYTLQQTLTTLQNQGHQSITTRTLERSLQEWGILKQIRTNIEQVPAIRIRIATLFFDDAYDDQEIVEQLKSEGFQISLTACVRLRKEMGIHRWQSHEDFQQYAQRYRTLIERELGKGVATHLGRGLLYYHFRNQGMVISRLDITLNLLRTRSILSNIKGSIILNHQGDPAELRPATIRTRTQA
jgi:arginine repressor